MSMQSGGGPGDLNSEINVTPMVDVMLVLLVIFMITAPMMNSGVDIDLPEVSAQNAEDPEGKLIMSIDKHGKLFLGATPVKWAELEVKLSTNQRVKTEKTLWVEAHQGLPYGLVVTAMAAARKAGVTKLMMLTDPVEHIDMSQLDKAPLQTMNPALKGAK